jgi:hypothetical protein
MYVEREREREKWAHREVIEKEREKIPEAPWGISFCQGLLPSSP